ncbi:MAG: glycosyltransferase family 4 protein [bacterium]|nr:glycosyltransferase family 4 protein [bacterium]
MRILIATGIFKPELGGPATYAAELGKRLQSAGHNVSVITYSEKQVHDLDLGFHFPIIRIIRQPSKLKNYLRYFWTVLSLMEGKDVIYTLDWFSAGLPVMVAAFLRRKKYIVRVGGGYIWEKYLSEGKPPVTLKDFYEKGIYKEYRIMYLLIKLVLRRASCVIFNSDEQRALYEKFYGLKKTSTMYNPVPESKLGTLVHTYKTEYTNRDKEIVFAGRFIKMKNAESVIKAFAKIKDQSFKLLLIGEGPTEPELRTLVKEHELGTRVEFHRPMSQTELYRRIANCYYVILPSWTDISPNQIYECLALSIPFLVTQENYLSINKHNFLKVDPSSVDDIAEKMNNLLDQKQYEAFVQSLQKLEFNHTWTHVVMQHMKIFNAAAKQQ